MFALQSKVAGQARSSDIDVYEESAPWYRHDPHRELDPQLAMIASYVDAEDTVIDWGGGAGRISLPLALRCREVVNIESSPSMQAFVPSSRSISMTTLSKRPPDSAASTARRTRETKDTCSSPGRPASRVFRQTVELIPAPTFLIRSCNLASPDCTTNPGTSISKSRPWYVFRFQQTAGVGRNQRNPF